VTYEDEAEPGNETQKNDSLGTSKEYPCLLRATDGKSRTISTHIAPSSLPTFQAHYGTLLKTTMTQTLRKRDKKKEKARVEAAALKKKKIMEGVLVEGPKRGKGRRKRERLEKVKVRLEEARKKLEEKEKQGK
jgi:signal recognition particle subunit SRP14